MYRKILFREYEDATFKTEKPYPPYLGFLGPILKGEVGDTIVVHFKNMADGNFSVHPHGLFYSKDSEGALYTDETKDADKKDDHVPRNGRHMYTWKITNSHAPADGDDDCLTWIYHSHVLPHKDINSGLIGKATHLTTLYYTTLHYTTLHCTTLALLLLHCTAQRHTHFARISFHFSGIC